MPRPRRALLPAIVLGVLGACAGDGGEPVELRLAELVRFADRYDGEVVATTGVVHAIEDPRHYWIQDEDINRVRIEPHSAVADRVGERVRVVGPFRYARDTGRLIEARRVTPAD